MSSKISELIGIEPEVSFHIGGIEYPLRDFKISKDGRFLWKTPGGWDTADGDILTAVINDPEEHPIRRSWPEQDIREAEHFAMYLDVETLYRDYDGRLYAVNGDMKTPLKSFNFLSVNPGESVPLNDILSGGILI